MIKLTLVGCENVGRYERAATRLGDVKFVAGDDASAAVVIHSETESRPTLAIEAARAAKHVLVTSPLARTAEEANAVIDACRTAGVRLMVAQTRRFLPAAAAIKEKLRSGKLGALGLLRIHRWEPGAPTLTAEIDIALWLFQTPPTEIYAATREIEAGTYLQTHLGFPDGGMALIDCAPAPPQRRGYYSLSVIGSSGAAYADDHHNTHIVYGDGDPRALVSDQQDACLASELREFVNAITENREPSVVGEDGLAALEIAAAVNRSSSSQSALRRVGGTYELV